jgi:hypothetical protein
MTAGLQGIGKEVVLSLNYPEGSEENHENPQPEMLF